ncbi:MAG TPA: helix-turn-helix transcriptional regulator [Bdellovibrio sp.]
MTKNANFAKYLKQKRENAGLSQKQVSEKLGYTTPQFISNWERGISTPPMKTVKKLASMYSISVDEIFNLLLQETLQQVTLDFKQKLKKIL